jgi:cyclopropane fatty-acyl-phospholipid synthase-like methyltransferase
MKRGFPLILLTVLSCAKPAAGPPAASPGASDAAHGPHQQGFHHRFEDASHWAQVFDDPARDAWQRPARVVELLALRPGMTVADVGAGTGYFEPWLSRGVGPSGKVLALDVETSMVRWIEDRAKREGLANVEAKLTPPADPSLAPGSVDRVLIVDTWHHLDDRRAYAAKLRAALREGGSVWVVDFTKESPHGPPAHARIAPAEVAAELGAAGLAAHVVDDAGLPDQYVVVGALTKGN